MTCVLVIGLVRVLMVIAILAGMVMLLTGIGLLTHSSRETRPEETADLRREVRDKSEVIGEHNVFRGFLRSRNDSDSR